MALTEQQLKDRKNGIGGSDSAKVLGLSRWGTPMSVYMEKVSDEEKEFTTSERMEWGNRLEQVIATEAVKRLNQLKEFKNHRFTVPIESTNVMREYPYILANVDFILATGVSKQEVILECKNSGASNEKDWGDISDMYDGIAPVEYLCQLQHYLMVYDLETGVLACLLGGNKLAIKIIKADKNLHKQMIECYTNFWKNFVEKRVVPAVLNDSDFKLLPNESDKYIQTDVDVRVKYILDLQEQLKDIEKIIEQEQNELKSIIGSDEGIISNSYKVSWKQIKSSRVDTEKLKTEYADAYKKCVKESSYRRFSISEKKGDVQNG